MWGNTTTKDKLTPLSLKLTSCMGILIFIISAYLVSTSQVAWILTNCIPLPSWKGQKATFITYCYNGTLTIKLDQNSFSLWFISTATRENSKPIIFFTWKEKYKGIFYYFRIGGQCFKLPIIYWGFPTESYSQSRVLQRQLTSRFDPTLFIGAGTKPTPWL